MNYNSDQLSNLDQQATIFFFFNNNLLSSKLKTRVGMFKNVGGNIPGVNFLGGDFPGGNFPGGSLMGGNFPGGSFLDTGENTLV